MFIITKVNENNIDDVLSRLNKKRWKRGEKAFEYNPYDDNNECPDKEIYLCFDDIWMFIHGLSWGNMSEEVFKDPKCQILSIEEFINQVNNYKEEQK